MIRKMSDKMKWVVTTDGEFYPTVEYFDTYEESLERYKEISGNETVFGDCNVSLCEVKLTREGG